MPIHNEKTCKRCATVKPSEDFYRRRNNRDLSPYCKLCSNSQTVERQRTLKQKAVDYLGGKCVKCGYDKCQAAFDFHHKDPSQKDFTIAHLKLTVWGEQLKRELDKCELLCANCHRETHWQERRFTNLSPKKPKKLFKCSMCDIEITYKAKHCVTCGARSQEKIIWPTIEELVSLVETTNYSEVARRLNVSDTAVRKRIKNHS